MTQKKTFAWFKSPKVSFFNSKKSTVFTTLLIFALTVLVFAFQNCKAPNRVNLTSDRAGFDSTPSPLSPTPTQTRTQSNCNSPEYNTQSDCNQGKPAHSTCSQQDNGCYAWECNQNYALTNNECVSNNAPSDIPEEQCENGEQTSQRACDNLKPSHSNCSQQAGGCYAWTCDTDYLQQGDKCVACKSQTSCNSTKPNNSTCLADSNGCYTWSCDTGYTLVNNQCKATNTECNDGEHPDQNTCNQNKPSNSTCSQQQNSSCYAWSCDNGYSVIGQECVEVVNGECASPPYRVTQLCIKGMTVEVSSSTQWNCNGLYGGTNDDNCNICSGNTYAFKSTCDEDTNKPANSHCQQIPTGETDVGCYKWICNNGYTFNTQANQCEQTATGTRVDGQCPSPPYNLNRLCVQGTPSVGSSPAPTQWDCEGLNNGTDASNCNTCPAASSGQPAYHPFKETCDANKPTNSTCQRASSGNTVGCWAWQCNTGFQLNSAGTACESSSTTTTTRPPRQPQMVIPTTTTTTRPPRQPQEVISTTTTTASTPQTCTCGTDWGKCNGTGCYNTTLIQTSHKTVYKNLGHKDNNRYTRITNPLYKWDCTNGKATVNCVIGQKTRCVGGFKRVREGDNSVYYPNKGFDGCKSKVPHFPTPKSYGSSCSTDKNNSSCTYIGYCDKSLGSCDNQKACVTTTCHFRP